MALKTLGTNATTTLSALVVDSNFTPADIATLRVGIKWDWVFVNGAYQRVQAGATCPGAIDFVGGEAILTVPRRGTLRVLPGDYVAIDPNGWPILVSGGSINSGSGWTHN